MLKLDKNIYKKSALKSIFGTHKIFFDLNGKIGKEKGTAIRVKGWNDPDSGIHYDYSDLAKKGEANTGVVLGSRVNKGYLSCIDIDFKDEGGARLSQKDAIDKRLQVEPFLAGYGISQKNFIHKVVTPSGGVHIFVVSRKKLKSKKGIKTDIGTIDFLGVNSLAIMFGSYNTDLKTHYEVDYFNPEDAEVLTAFDPIYFEKSSEELAESGIVIFEGERDNTIFNKALTMFRAGVRPQFVVEELLTFNIENVNPPLDEKIVRKCVASASSYMEKHEKPNENFLSKLKGEHKRIWKPLGKF